jgi:hypothetical protein
MLIQHKVHVIRDLEQSPIAKEPLENPQMLHGLQTFV